jgi:hypothetical protein
MRRRTLLRGLAIGAGAAVPAGLLVDGIAEAAASSYFVVLSEQTSNRILAFDKSLSWTTANIHWSFAPGTGNGWSNLSDVKIRKTAAQGWVALVAASGGRAGVVDIGSKKAAGLGDVKWSALPGGNPHAIERIPGNGSVVTASAETGLLTVYAPSKISDLGTLAKVQQVPLAGAHGVLWDPTYQYLWAIGKGKLVPYSVTGTYRGTRLAAKHGSISLGTYVNSAGATVPNLGHDLQPDYTSKSTLLITHTTGVFSVDTGTRKLTRISSSHSVKAYLRHSSGERAWIQGDGTDPRNWANNTVQFFTTAGAKSFTRTRSGAQFYKVRLWTPDYE